MIESVNLNWDTKIVTVTFEDGTSKEYVQAEDYIADHPDRVADAVAMGWEAPSEQGGV